MNAAAHLGFFHSGVGALLEGLCCTVTVHIGRIREGDDNVLVKVSCCIGIGLNKKMLKRKYIKVLDRAGSNRHTSRSDALYVKAVNDVHENLLDLRRLEGTPHYSTVINSYLHPVAEASCRRSYSSSIPCSQSIQSRCRRPLGQST